MALLDAKIAEVEVSIKAADSTIERRRLKIKREDLMRLRRVEQIYVRSYCGSSFFIRLFEYIKRAQLFPCSLTGCLSC